MEQNNFSYAKRKVFAIPVLLFVISLIGLISALPAYQPFPYDTYSDGIINTTLWNPITTGSQCVNTETASSYIETFCDNSALEVATSSSITSLLMPPRDYIENITLHVYSRSAQGSAGESGITASGTLYGIVYAATSAPTSPNGQFQQYEGNWTMIRNYSAGTNYFSWIQSYDWCVNAGCTYFNTNGTTQATNDYLYIQAQKPYLDSSFSGNSRFRAYIINYTLNNRIITVNSSYPLDNLITNNGNVTFNGTAITNNYNTGHNSLVNMSIVLDGIINQTVSVTGMGVTNYSSFNLTNIPLGTHSWSIQACDDSGTCRNSDNRTMQISYLTIVNQSYTTPVYETSAQYFEINTQFNTAVYPNAFAYLNYSGTIYTTNITKTVNGNDVKYNITIDVPASIGVKIFHWDLYSDPITIQNSIDTNQTINAINFSICGGAGGSTPFVNMVYLDENLLTPVNLNIMSSSWNYWLGSGSTYKSYFYNNVGSNASSNNSFCFVPASVPSSYLYTSTTFQYGLTGVYPTRTFTTTDPPFLTLTNASSNINLYTLSFTESGSVTFQVVDTNSANVISGALVRIQRNIGGSLVTVFSGLTDDAGTVNVYLSTTATYTITASKDGCGTNTKSIIPVGSYNIQLACATAAPLFNSTIQGITYQRSPKDGVNNEVGWINYEYYVASSSSPIYAAKFTLKDDQGTIIATNETNVSSGYSYCNATSCHLTITYYTVSGDDIKGSYYINLGNNTNYDYILLESDAFWRFITINPNNSNSGITRFADHFNEFFYQWEADGNCRAYLNQVDCTNSGFCKWINNTGYSNMAQLCILKDDYNKAEFSRIILIFFGIVTVLFIIGKTTGYEMTNPGSFVMFMTGAIIIMSILGFFRFNGLTPNTFLDQYIYAFICLCFSIGYNLSIIRRYSA